MGVAREDLGIVPLPVIFSSTIALWWCDLDLRRAGITAWLPWLSAGEKLRAARFGSELLRQRYVAGRTALRWILAQRLGLESAAVPLQVARHGRPQLSGPHRSDFNVSHTGGFALIALLEQGSRPRRIGIDLERADRKPNVDRLSRKVLADTERKSLEVDSGAERNRRFLRYWTCKEAMSKATGDGLRAPFAALEVRLDEAPRLIDGPPPYLPSDWELHVPAVPAGYLAAVAKWTPPRE